MNRHLRYLATGMAVLLGSALPVPMERGWAGPASDRGTVGMWQTLPSYPDQGCVRLTQAAPGMRAPRASVAADPFPLMVWPIGVPQDGPMVVVAYKDHDPISGFVLDYAGHVHATDGHRGTDYAILNHHMMDSGVAVYAAADGVVTGVTYDKYDRNVLAPFPDQGNYVWVAEAGNTTAQYWHLRTNSVTVQVGDSVKQGQMIAMVGSSGFSFQPHLHQEFWEVILGVTVSRDPFAGPVNPYPTGWLNQEPYVGLDPVRVFDQDIMTLLSAGGNIGAVTSPQLMERVTAPAVMGTSEPQLGLWILISGQQGDSVTVRIIRPDSSEFGSQLWVMPAKALWTWVRFAWGWNGQVSGSDHGTWRVTAENSSGVLRESAFEVGAVTHYAPRFYPVAGRSLRLGSGEVRDTLRLQNLGGPASYRLMEAPPFVSIVDDSIVQFDSGAVISERSVYFQVEAEDAQGYTDTMWYHLVDPSRPLSCGIDLTGDVNLSGTLTSADIIGLVGFVFTGGGLPQPCEASGDVNCSGAVTSADIIAMVNHVFKGGEAPCDACTLTPDTWSCP